MAKRRKKKATGGIDTGAYDYKTLRVRGKDGKILYSRGNSDAVAKAMLLDAANGGTTAGIIKANKLKIEASGNAGLQRMSVGVSLRGLVNNGTPVKIGKLTISKLNQKIDLPKVELLAGNSRKAVRKTKKMSKPRKARAPKASKAEDFPVAEAV